MRGFNLTIFALIAIVVTLFAATQSFAQEFLIDDNEVWRYWAEQGTPDPAWRDASYDDSDWNRGVAGFGYGDDDDTTLLADMENSYRQLFVRKQFELSSVPQNLYLYVRYDDAFVAYLNGEPVALGGFSQGEVQSHEADSVEGFVLDTSHAQPGTNLLAIHGINRSIGSSDFSLQPMLAASVVDFGVLSSDDARSMLSELKSRLLTQSSYLLRTGRDVIGALDAYTESVHGPTERVELARAMQKIVAMIGDGHARVGAEFLEEEARYLPFSLAEAEGGVVGLHVGEQVLVDSDYPYVRAIDGIDIERWISTAGLYVSRASPQLNRRLALRSVQQINLLRRDFELPDYETVRVVFAGGAGTVTKELPLADEQPRTARIETEESEILPGNIGYLVIRRMRDARIPEIHRRMREFKSTNGLIIDVRDNGGGRYGIMRALVPYFLPPSAGPIVANIAKYRLAASFERDHLASRPTFRLDHEDWSDAERAVIRAAEARFDPIWAPPAEDFSAWHYMLVNRKSDRTRRTYHYRRRVVVLSNSASFSATDVSCRFRIVAERYAHGAGKRRGKRAHATLRNSRRQAKSVRNAGIRCPVFHGVVPGRTETCTTVTVSTSTTLPCRQYQIFCTRATA